jgi:hypothetical protein
MNTDEQSYDDGLLLPAYKNKMAGSFLALPSFFVAIAKADYFIVGMVSLCNGFPMDG